MENVPYNNDDILAWARNNLASIKRTIPALGIKHSKYSRNPKPLAENITLKVHNNINGQTDKISYGMPRSGVFEHKGVGRGHPITNPRQAKHWFDIPTDINLPDLEKIVAENDCTYVVNNLKIK